MISKRQGDQRKHSLPENNRLHKRENGFIMKEISHNLMDCSMKQLTLQFHKIFFHISKGLASNVEKPLQLKNKKRVNIANFINIHIYRYIYIYIYIIYIYIYIYIYHLGNNKGILELMKTYYELKHLSHLDNVFIT